MTRAPLLIIACAWLCCGAACGPTLYDAQGHKTAQFPYGYEVTKDGTGKPNDHFTDRTADTVGTLAREAPQGAILFYDHYMDRQQKQQP